MRTYCILVADSRARDLGDFEGDIKASLPGTVNYITVYICVPGAKILDLYEPLIAKLNSLSRREYACRFIIKIAAGINNLTHKYNIYIPAEDAIAKTRS